MFDALASLSSIITDAYHRASQFGDLHLGDLHFVKLDQESAPQFVALAVVQSYNPRRKVPRSGISMSDLEACLSKACFSAVEFSGNFLKIKIVYN